MRFLQKLFDKMFFGEFDPYSLSIFRIVLGSSILLILIASFPHWETYYASNGVMSLNESDLPVISSDRLSIFHYTDSVIPVKFFFWIGIIFSITFILGLFTKLSTFILFVLVHSMFYRNFFITAGYDAILRMLLFFSLFISLNSSISIGKIFKRQQVSSPPLWPVRIMQLCIASIYLVTTYKKIIGDPVWLNGEGMYFVVSNELWSVFSYPELFYKWNGIISKLLTYSTLLIELSFPILVWFKKTRLLIIFITAIFHICIALVMPDIYPFTMIMISSFILFLPGETLRTWFIKQRQ